MSSLADEGVSDETKNLILRILKLVETSTQTIGPLISGNMSVMEDLKTIRTDLLDLMVKLNVVTRNQDVLQEDLSKLKVYISDMENLKEIPAKLEKLENAFVSRVIKQVGLGKIDEITEEELSTVDSFATTKKNKDLLKLLGSIYKEKELPEKELHIYTKILEIDDKDICALCRKGTALQDLGRHTEALTVFESLDKSAKCYPTVYRFRAYSNAVLGRKEEAFTLIDKAIEGNEKDYLSWSLKGHFLVTSDRFAEAISVIEKALELKPDLDVALTDKGITLMHLGPEFRNEALETLKKAYLNKKGTPTYWHNLGVAYAELEMDKEAEESFTEAIELGSKDACTYCYRGIARNRLGNNEGAIEDFEKASKIGLKRECGHFYLCKGIVLQKLGKIEKSTESFVKAVALESNPSEALFHIVANFAILGKKEEMKQKLSEVTALMEAKKLTVSPRALNGLAYAFYNLKDYSEGLKYAESAIAKDPNNPYVLDTLACLQSGLGQYEKSLETFETALKLRKSDVAITWNELAFVYEKLGRNDEAKKIREEHKL